MRQFAGHWYSGRAARLCAVEALLVALSLWVTGRQAAGNLPALAALIGAAACVPAALYLADLYDPQVMRNDRARGSNTLKALTPGSQKKQPEQKPAAAPAPGQPAPEEMPAPRVPSDVPVSSAPTKPPMGFAQRTE